MEAVLRSLFEAGGDKRHKPGSRAQRSDKGEANERLEGFRITRRQSPIDLTGSAVAECEGCYC